MTVMETVFWLLVVLLPGLLVQVLCKVLGLLLCYLHTGIKALVPPLALVPSADCTKFDNPLVMWLTFAASGGQISVKRAEKLTSQ